MTAALTWEERHPSSYPANPARAIKRLRAELTTTKIEKSLTTEEWREYEFPCGFVYRIDRPKALVVRPGGTTHRVVDSENVVHCIPFGGSTAVVLRWKSWPQNPPVGF